MGLKEVQTLKASWYKIRKITKTSAVYPHYEYQIRFTAGSNYDSFDRVAHYLEVQRWCQETFGHSMDYQFFYYPEAHDGSEFFNAEWCYQSELKGRKYCIYLNEHSLTMFLLKWTA